MLRNNDGGSWRQKAGDKGEFTAEIWTKGMKKGTKEGKKEGERRKGGKKEGGGRQEGWLFGKPISSWT